MFEAIDLARATLPHERRQQPRVHTSGRVEFCPVGGRQRLAARLVDFSLAGLRLRCSRAEALAFVAAPGLGGADLLCGEWRLLLADRRLAFVAVARRCYLQKASEDELALGFEFTDLDNATRRCLEEWVVSHLEPA
jgi:c-di-GMP-binding flagellar brake protein YcgR